MVVVCPLVYRAGIAPSTRTAELREVMCGFKIRNGSVLRKSRLPEPQASTGKNKPNKNKTWAFGAKLEREQGLM